MRINQKKLKMAGVIVFLAATLTVTAFAARWVLSLSDPLKFADFQQWVASLGMGGWLLLLAIQYAQIVIAFIPGGPIQIVAGALYGPWGGMAVCVSGTLLATATVFYLVSRYGRTVISLFVEEKELLDYKFLHGENRLERLVMLLFFIPGTPKDALTYLFALTEIPMSRFMLLSTVARLPAIATSLVAGDSIVEGRWVRALVMFIVMTVVTVAGYFIQRLLRKRLGKGKETARLSGSEDDAPL